MRSPRISSRPSTQLKLLACQEARASLKDQLSALEERWQPISQRVQQRHAEATDRHRSLRNCIRKQNEVAKSCTIIENNIKILTDVSDRLKKSKKDSEERAEKLVDMIVELKKDIMSRSTSLKEAEEKVKALTEMNKSLSMQLNGLEYHQGAESKNSTCASAKGKEKVREA